METYDEFLKNHIVVKELTENKPKGKIYYKAIYDGKDYSITALTMEAMTWTTKRLWKSRCLIEERKNNITAA